MGEPVSLWELVCWAACPSLKLIVYGVFLFRILFYMCSFLGLTGPIESSPPLTSLSSGKKWLWLAEDMLALFYRLLFLTCSLPIFFLTLTSFICDYYCMEENRDPSANELLPTLTPLLEVFRTGLLPSDRPRTMRGEAISLMLIRLSLSSIAVCRCLYFRFMLKKFREQGSISCKTLMILVNISDETL